MYNKRIIILTVGLIIVVALTTFTPSVWAWLAEAPESHRAPLLPLFQSSINPPAVIAGAVFDDLDGDGEQDAGESGIPDVTVELLQDGSVIVTTTTDDNGDYTFIRGLAGDYTVRETDLANYASTTPNEVDVSITAPGQAVTDVDFGDRGIGAIEGTVFDDRDGNAVQDEGEPGIGGATITLLQDGSTVSTTTAANGAYQFTSLHLGDYTVRETDPPGYASTTPNEVPVSLATPGQMETVDFGDRGIGAIEGTVFDDRNGNAVQDEGEPGIDGVTVTLLQDGSTISTTITTADGAYQFTSLHLGDYTVRETDPPGYASTTPNEVPVSLATPGQTETVYFGDRGIGGIEGTVFDDRNGNAVQDEGEPGIGSVIITLLQNGSTVDTTTTTSDGSYEFASMWLGDYTVRETDPPGYASTTPNEVPVSLATPGQVETVDFGDRGVGAIEGLVFDDRNGNAAQDEGEPGIGGVIITLLRDGSTVDTTTTAGNGTCQFASVWLGDYTVRETDPPGYASTTPNEVPVSLITAGQIVTDVTFGDRGIGTIEGTVFDDRNGNWVQDEGEPGIGGVTISLLQDGSTVSATVTAANGAYQFTSLWLGDYTVRETDPANYVSITPNEADISLDTPGQVETVNFGDQSQATVNGVVFNDLDGDGVRDAGEPGIGGVEIALVGEDTMRTTTTASDGSYEFTSIPAGDYTVQETDPSGFSSTTPNSVAVSLEPGDEREVNFGDYGLPGEINGTVFDDLNGNGLQDAGEPGLNSVTVELRSAGDVVATTQTQAGGNYTFTNVTPGGYTVQETDPVGYASTTANEVSVSVPPAGVVTVNFGDQGIGTVSGVVFEDLNGNGVQDAEEDGIENVTVELWQGDSKINTTTTNGNGVYEFTNVDVGNHTVRETDPPGYVSTTPNKVAVSVAAGGSATASFGDQPVSIVSGVVFNDQNGNGAQDVGETGIPVVTVELWQGDSKIDTTTTDGNGAYAFTGVTMGSYTVRETDPAGYVSTTPNKVVVSVAAGGSATANFGDQQVGAISGVVFNDFNGNGVQDTGEPGIAGVTVWRIDDGETVTRTTDSGGAYLFTAVTPGNYIIEAARPAGFVNTTPGEVLVSVASGGSATANFGYQQVGTVSGVAFNDANGNGVRDAGENGIGGVVVTCDTASATTAGDGSYLFSGVEPGNYTVSAADVPGFAHTTPDAVVVSVAPGGSASANFGFQGQGTVSGVAFNDANANGVRDTGESGIGGLVISLNGSETMTTATSGDGVYSFSDVAEGNYSVEAEAPAGFVRTTPGLVHVSVAPEGSGSANFGFQGQGTVSGVAFNDANGNGVKDAGESGIGGLVISLSGSETVTTSSSGDGAYSFSDVTEGNYIVEAETPVGFVQTTPGQVHVSVAAGGSASANFGFQGQGTVSGMAFNDTNGNGVKDGGENGIGGVIISLNGYVVATSGDGSYSFNVSDGNYWVLADAPAGFVHTTPGLVAVSVAPGGSANANFGFQGQGTVSGVAFNDANGNGVKDTGEGGIGGLVISLSGSETMTTTTSGDGAYNFSNVPAGSHTVETEAPAGFVRTTSGAVLISVASGGSASANFGFQGQGTVSGVAFNDANGNGVKDTGESGIGGVVISLLAGEEITPTDVVTTTGDGAYSFSDVPEGSYTVQAEAPSGFVRTTPGLVHVSVAPDGSANANFGFQGQGTVSGVAFNDLDGNGMRDAGEGGIGGVTISLNGYMATTSGDGSYSFDVSAGNYLVLADAPAGFVHTTPGLVAVSVAPGSSASANFGFQGRGTVSGVAFNDLNGNGIKDSGENGIGGLVISLIGSRWTITTTTSGDGSYNFRYVDAGSYTVMADKPLGFVRTTPGLVAVSVAAGGSGSANFGFQGQGTVSGVAFSDANANGLKDAGENGIGGLVVLLVGSSETITATTCGDGSYSFSDIPAGSYIAWAPEVVGFVRTTPGLVPVSVAPAGSATANFGFMAQGQVSGQCFQDLDGDGEHDPSEPGVVCTATLASDPVTMLSNPNGFYAFSDVEPGAHTLSAILPAGFAHWSAPEQPVSVAPGGSASGDFSSQRQGTISGRVFNDVNGDGSQDPGENGLGGVVVSLSGETTTTTGDGTYSFDQVSPGLYTVKETDPQGYASTTANEAQVYVSAGGSANVNFGDQAIGTVSGLVFNDLNRDGIKGDGEAGIGGVTVTLKTAGGDPVEATTTAGNGAFIFTQVGEGDFIVEEADPEGFVSTTSNASAISLSAGESSASVNFGDQLAGSVSGVVFYDANGDGVQYAGEHGIAGAMVTLTLEGGGVFTTTTAGDGSYLFSEVEKGSHTVEEADPEGFTTITPNVNVMTITLSAENPSASANFGDLPVGTVSGSVFNDLDGDEGQGRDERGIGGVTITLSTVEGTLVATRKTVGDGTYAFSGVDAGEYFVEETNPDRFGSTTPDRVRITVPEGGSATVNFGDRVEYRVYLPAAMKQYGQSEPAKEYKVFIPAVLKDY